MNTNSTKLGARRNGCIWKQVARETGLSQATISRVFNRQPYVRSEIRQKVLAASRRLGYVPRVARRRTTVAIIVGGLEQIVLMGYETMMINMLTKHLSQNQLAYEIVSLRDLNTVAEHFVQGGISVAYAPEILARFKTFPLIAISAFGEVPSISSDHREGVRMAVEHLLIRGHRRIGIVLNSRTTRVAQFRIAGYQQAFADRKLACRPEWIQTIENQSLPETMERLCRQQITALLVCGEDLGIQAYHALGLLGRRIPEDISMISYELPSVSPFLWPAQTTVAQDFDRIAELCVQHLGEMMAGKKFQKLDVRVPCRLIERGSVRSLV